MAARRRNRLRACAECDLVVEMPVLRPGERASCPRCQHPLQHRQKTPLQNTAAICVAALIMLLASLPFQFAHFELPGSAGQMAVLDAVGGLMRVDQALLALVVVLTIVVLPAVYLLAVAYLHIGLLLGLPLWKGRVLLRLLRRLEPWMMADVFLVATLVSLIKMSDDADVGMGLSFWAFCAYALLLLKTTIDINYDHLWLKLEGEAQAPFGARPGTSARSQQLQACRSCGQLVYRPGLAGNSCPRCSGHLPALRASSTQVSWALLLTAVMLYIPANTLPIMETTKFGNSIAANIMGGVIIMWEDGSIPVALVIFIASIVVPLFKMLVLGWLCLLAGQRVQMGQLWRYRLYRLIEFVGRWSMVDVFVVAILVAMVQQGTKLSVLPGPAALAFCSVVVVTMLATRAFDPKLIWHADEMKQEVSP